MASTRKSPRSSTLAARVAAILNQHVKRGTRLVVGLSGGVDSVVLLDLLHRASASAGFELAALHVNHRINPAAERWAAFCRRLCRKMGLPCRVARVTVPRGSSLEAAARSARYRVFAATPADFLALAHHLDDQAETVMLQLLRGAGVRGLSAMPVVRTLETEVGIQEPGFGVRLERGASGRRAPGAAILRPLLDVTRDEIVAYARARGLDWVEDDSNSDPAYDRNYLRHQVLPLIAARYPAYRETLSRASRNFAEAAHLLDELASIDMPGAATGLSISALRRLSVPRAKNAVRHWLARHGVRMPNAARLEEGVRQLLQASHTARLVIDVGDRELRCHGDLLCITSRQTPVPEVFCRRWRGETSLRLPELGGTLNLIRSRGRGLSLARLGKRPVTVRLRQGGERLQPDPGRPRRSLKNLLQEAGIPFWSRLRLPLLFAGNTLIYVPGIGADAAFQATHDEPGIEPRWIADVPAATSFELG